MKVDEIMMRSPVTVTPETSLKDVIEVMVRARVSGLPVIDRDGHLVGIVTEADAISKEAYGTVRHHALALLIDEAHRRHWVARAGGATAGDVMSSAVVVCAPDDDVHLAARRMLESDVRQMPVVVDGALVGIVARRDILRMFDRPDDAIAAEVAEVLAHHPELPDDQHVGFSVAAGIVTLTGDVRFGWDAPVVVSIVRGVPGVIDVVNQLHRREPNPPSVPERWALGPW